MRKTFESISESNNYLETPVMDISAENTLYMNYMWANQKRKDKIAIVSMDGKEVYTHRLIMHMIDKVADGLSGLAVDGRYKIGIMLNNTVEETVFLLAINKLGALSKFIDLSKSIQNIKKSIEESTLDMLVMDELFLAMEPMVNQRHVPVIVVRASKPYPEYILYEELLQAEDQELSVKPVPYVNDKPSVIINSSGTTGRSKPIVHSDYSVNMAAVKMFYSDFSLTENNVMVKILPSYISLGLVTTLYSCLISGTVIVLISGINHDDPMQPPIIATYNNAIQFAINFPNFCQNTIHDKNAKLLIIAPPTFFRMLAESVNLFSDLSYIGALLAGGAKMSKEELDDLDSLLAKKDCPVRICVGYGQNEMCAAVTLNSNSGNKKGSAGFPVIGTKIQIVDPDTLKSQPIGSEGLILEQAESKFLFYDNLPEDTAASEIVLADGSVWFNTRDLGYMDQDGYLYITGRTSRVLIYMDLKISIDVIETKIKSHPAVANCAVIAREKYGVGEVPVGFLTLKPAFAEYTVERILGELQKSDMSLSEMERPDQIEIVEALPYMGNGKIDYQALKELISKDK